MKNIVLILLFLSMQELSFTTASVGDSSPFYQKCVSSCVGANCTSDGNWLKNKGKQQDSWNRLLQWSCRNECQYNCMWQTVHGFQARGYDVPKFHGKWPFQRFFGIQEPASVLSSLMNLAAHVYMNVKIIKQFPVRKYPLVLLWHSFAAVCIHAWLWSTIFHTRDNLFTEFMDYASALSMVMALFIAAIIRVFHKRKKLTALIVFFSLVYYWKHTLYLYTGVIDYDYNMAVNIFFGVSGSLVWLYWSGVQCLAVWGSSKVQMPYTWRLIAFTLLSAAALLLELFDFPPHHGWDAHALWHLTTAPLTLLFYRFVIDDLKHLYKASQTEDNYLKLK